MSQCHPPLLCYTPPSQGDRYQLFLKESYMPSWAQGDRYQLFLKESCMPSWARPVSTVQNYLATSPCVQSAAKGRGFAVVSNLSLSLRACSAVEVLAGSSIGRTHGNPPCQAPATFPMLHFARCSFPKTLGVCSRDGKDSSPFPLPCAFFIMRDVRNFTWANRGVCMNYIDTSRSLTIDTRPCRRSANVAQAFCANPAELYDATCMRGSQPETTTLNCS